MLNIPALVEQAGANIPSVRKSKDKFAGQVVLVTGAAQGIGAVTATSFAAQGATVVLVDLNESKAKGLSEKLNADGAKTLHMICDLTNETGVSQTINDVVQNVGKLDVLVHLAGIYPFKPFREVTAADYRLIMSVNMDSTFFLAKAALPHMNRAGYGRIITTTSGVVLCPEAGLSVYAAAKGAVLAFTRALSVEAGPGVTVNSVCPSLIYNESTLANPGSQQVFEKAVARQAVKRYGLPTDVSEVITFIASPETEFITGQNYDIGGGFTHGA